MKQLFMIFCTVSIMYANHIQWNGKYDEALKQAKNENKILMVLLIKNNCKKCQNIVKDIFMNKPYINDLNQNLISVIVNIDNKHSFPIEMYWSNSYPTLFFVDSQNETFICEPLYDISSKNIQNILQNNLSIVNQ